MRFHQVYIVFLIPSETKFLTIKTLKNTVKNINANDTRTYGTGIISCNCTNPKCLNYHHGHITTGDLWIIKNKKLLKIRPKKLPNYREPKTVNWKKK